MRTCTIHDERPNTNGNTFAVMLLPVPSLPEGMEAASGEMVMQAVIGATDHELGEGKAGWVVLSSEEKDAIGYALHEHGAEVHRWYWCQLWEQDDSVQETHAVVPREFEAAMATGKSTKTVSETDQMIELLSENLDTLSEEELLAECAEDFGNVDVMVKMFDAAVTKATAQASPPLTFTQGVLCSLSILDRYGDSIAYREVANPHDPNQLWEEADEFDREHLARHGYRPTPAAQESGDA